MTIGTIVLIFVALTAGGVICLLGILLFSLTIDTLEESETGRWILDRITKRKR